jgi:hypothetical protein
MSHIVSDSIAPLNMLPTNKYNSIRLVDNKVTKTGPTTFLRGEIFFYKNIPETSISSYFPKYYGSSVKEELSELYIEAIKGIPFYTLFKQKLINKTHIKQLFEFIDILHNIPGSAPTDIDLRLNYTAKLEKRFSILSDYPFSDAKEIQQGCLTELALYRPTGLAYIHGDLWFSNILVDFNGSLKFLDMKGQVNGHLTTGGDRLYDYGKLYQSFLGYDAALYGDTLDEKYKQDMLDLFIGEIKERGITIEDLSIVTRSLVIGTLHFIEDYTAKQRIWTFYKSI